MSYIAADNIDDLIKSSKKVSTALSQEFDNNLFKNNPGESHLLISSNENITVKIGKCEIENNEWKKLLGVKLDCKPNFDEHIFLTYVKKLLKN